MPDANSYLLCAYILKMSAIKNILIIILSNKETIVDRVRGKIIGAAEIIDRHCYNCLVDLNYETPSNFSNIG